MNSLALLIYATVLTPCHGFSVDTEQPVIFQETAEGFGQSVVQFGRGANAGVLVGAPLQRGDVNETGKLYRCRKAQSKSGSCQEVTLQRPNDAINMSLGLSVSAYNSQLLVCGPTVQQACGTNMYIKGYCFLLDQDLRQIQHFPKSLPKCTIRATDIVLLIDGSGSIEHFQFTEMKTFISKIMKKFRHTSAQFALAQYSSRYKEHFDFLQYQQSSDPDDLIRGVSQLKGGTRTATYIQKVGRELFLPQKGSRNEASKILIVITDGEKQGDRLEYSDVIPEIEAAGIIRFAIGVGRAFDQGTSGRRELNAIASAPASDHVFSVDNFDALNDIQNQLQDKIFAIEGTQSQSSSSFQLEMSQEGFSALLTPDGSVLGAVGAYDWSGGIFLYGNDGNASFINVSSSSKDMNDAYLGYSVQMVKINRQISYVVGAPRYQHVGRVVMFSQENGQWSLKSELSLKQPLQIGSYFGATLCSVDLDRDTDANTDLVLIGAPMYYDGTRGGRVYICQRKRQTFTCGEELRGVPKNPLGRFGTSIAELGEITGDRWTDVAIGAPMEDNGQGAVYIFQGTSRSINQTYSQRIQASLFGNRLHYFGQTIGAGIDLTEDGLSDITAGAQGQVLLLRSRPVLQVLSQITFNPPVIPISAFVCQNQEELNKEVSKATVCLTVQLISRFTLDSSISNTLQYTLTLDPGRLKVRAVFVTQSSTTEVIQIGLDRHCKEYRIKLPTCIEDSLTPINLRLNYTLTGNPIPAAGNLRAILRDDQSHQFIFEPLHFEKDCGSDGVCKDELKASFNFSGLGTLVVGLTPELNATVFIRNNGEDSFSTKLTFSYPSALSYRRFTLLQSNRKYISIKCSSKPVSEYDPVTNTTCDINHPIFRSGAEVIFIATFSVSQDVELGSVVQMNATASSENHGPITQDMIHQATLPVKYAVYIFVNAIDKSTKYVNFSTGQEDGNQMVEHWYEIKNTYQRSIPVSVTFRFPVQLNRTWVWNASVEVPSELSSLVQCAPGNHTTASKDFVKQLGESPILNCFVAACKIVHCNISSLEQQQPLKFSIKGKIGFQWLSQIQQKKVTLLSSARISYDETKYTQEGERQSQVNTVVEHLVAYNYLPAIIGSSLAGLILLAVIAAVLYKVGFFKRQYKTMMDEAGAEGNEETGPVQDGSPDATTGMETK
ncbi:integrin alpha-X-like [Tiliqua scincoides]|uniref:integrin alpha-X-like n=1 Tax=Tiliqua scincoides TaxID=71010 RepID=UPI00346212DA